MSNNDQYEYPGGSEQDQKYSMLSKEGRTESLIPSWARDPKILSMTILAGVFFYLVSHLLSYALGERNEKKADVAIQQSKQKIDEISNRISTDSESTKQTLASFSDKVSDIKNNNDNTLKKVDAYAEKIDNIIADNKKTDDDITALKAEISAITEKLSEINRKLTYKKPGIKKYNQGKKPIKLETFTLRAMIHGRAWVENDKGSYMTVKVGDMLPTYGRIVYIDDQSGTLKTTSGRDIKFSTN